MRGFLVQEVFLFHDAGKGDALIGLIHDRIGLEIGGVEVAGDGEFDAAVFKGTLAVLEIGVYGAGVEDMFLALVPGCLGVAGVGVAVVEGNGDAGMGEHFGDEGGVALLGEGLEAVGEIAGVKVGADWDAGEDFGGELRGVLGPLLSRVGTEEFLVERVTDAGEGHFFAVGGSTGVGWVDLVTGEPSSGFVGGLEVGTGTEGVDGGDVDWDGDELVVCEGDDAVFPATPAGEAIDVFPDFGVVGVKKMGTLFVHEDARFGVGVIVAVTGDVVAGVNHVYVGFGVCVDEAFGDDCAG